MEKVKREKQKAKDRAVGPSQHFKDRKSQPCTVTRSNQEDVWENGNEGGKCLGEEAAGSCLAAVLLVDQEEGRALTVGLWGHFVSHPTV